MALGSIVKAGHCVKAAPLLCLLQNHPVRVHGTTTKTANLAVEGFVSEEFLIRSKSPFYDDYMMKSMISVPPQIRVSILLDLYVACAQTVKTQVYSVSCN